MQKTSFSFLGKLSCIAAILLAALPLFSGLCQAADSTFYRNETGLFSLRPDADARVVHLTGLGPVGLQVDLIQPAFTMVISDVEKGSPAETAGLKKGDYILSINGEHLRNIDPRIQLGNWITEAEATDGRWVMEVADKLDGAPREVVVRLNVLGSYSKSWPLDCPKSDQIVRNFANYLKQSGSNKGFADIGMLFLLSTGDQSDLEYVSKWARAEDGSAGYPWHIGYGGLALCEYYLRTGDREVLPAIQRMADKLVELENFGGWAGRGSTARLSYGGGGGHLNAAGVLCVGYLMLAVECGAKVPEETLERVLTRFYRYSGRGNVPYGQGRPEGGFTDNGKNGKLAFSMAAAANLDPSGEQSIYAKARDASAQFSFYSSTYMLHGHTGGGIGEIWRSSAMGLLNEKQPNHYREFMDSRRWHYEMSRRFDGSFAILGGDRYDEVSWGAAYALTYTIPRKNLRLAGAPATKYSKTHALPKRPWGTAEDDEFQSMEPAVMANGQKPDISKETFAEHSGLHLLRTIRENSDDIKTIRNYIHHPDYVIRSAAAASIQKHGVELLKEFLASEDARVRRAALEGIEGAPGKLLTREIFDHLVAMLRDEKESMYVQDLALQLLGKAPDDWIVGEIDLILPYLEHEEWWFQNAALQALAPVVADPRCYQKVLPAIGQLLRSNYRYNVTGPIRWGELPDNLRNAPPKVRQLALESFREAYFNYVDYDHNSERVQQVVNPTTQEAIIKMLAGVPGGYDAIYQLGKQQYPEMVLPFKEVFLDADRKNMSPELAKIVDQTVGSNLIPQYVAKHRKSLLEEARSEAGDPRRPKMPGLIDLYEKVGVNDYSWEQYGPESQEMEWSYFSFDPKEKFMKDDDRLGRFREVTFPSDLQTWFAMNFNPQKMGWQRGQAPFGAADGKLERFTGDRTCHLSFCGCDKPLNTLWENDVLLIRGDFEFPPFEEGYRYRILHGGISHVGSGGGYRLYVNGKLFAEVTSGVDRRAGGRPEGRVIPADWWPAFADGKVTLAAMSFKKNHPKTKAYGGNLSFFIQRQKVPPVEAESLAKAE